MKKEQRLVYKELSLEADAQLCAFCKKAESLGCEDGMACIHPLNKDGRLFGEWDGIEPGEDCFLFRPNLPVRDIADIVGLILSNGFTSWSYLIEDDGTIKVFGRANVR